MRSRIFLQIVVVIVFLLLWNILIIGKQYQEELSSRKLDDVPVLLYSRLFDDLVDLKQELETQDYIDHVEIQQDTLIAQELIEVYKLESAFEVLKNYKLPSIGQIFVKGIKFNKAKYQQLQNLIFEKYHGISINYKEDLLNSLEIRFKLLEKIFFIIAGVLIILALIVVSFLRIHFEHHHNNYWQVFSQSGGDPYKREKIFWGDSIYLTILPMILVGGAYWGLQYKDLLPYKIDLLYLGIEFGILIFITVLSRLILGKKF